MPPSPFPIARTGFRPARRAARRAWLTLAAVALVPGWAAARIVPGYLTVGAPPPLSGGAPNLWAIVQPLPWIGGLPLAGLAMAIAAGAAAWLAAHFSAHPPHGEKVLPAALLVALVIPGLLPQMQPHDFLLAVGLSLVFASRRRRHIAIAALVGGGWLLAILVSPPLGAAPVILATLLTARRFLVLPANDNGLPLNPHRAYPA